MNRIQALVMIYFLGNASSSLAGSMGREQVLVHPFGGVPSRSFSFSGREIEADKVDRPPMSLRAKTDTMMQDWGLSPRIQSVQKGFRGFNLGRGQLIQTLDYKFKVDGVALCQYQIKASETLDGKLAVFGKMPQFTVDREYSLADWPAYDAVSLNVAEKLGQVGLSHQFTRNSSEPCLWLEAGELQTVFVWEIEVDQLNYSVVADATKVYKFLPKHFHASGKAKVYPQNVLDGATKEYPLREMNATGFLENSYFTTVVKSPFVRAQSSNLDFSIFDPSTDASKFAEVSLFTNANRQLEWLESMGYNSFGKVPIRIEAHVEFQGDPNNALYQPGTEFESIMVGDGDGRVLQNLATDADVVGHELGHHVVYATVKDIQGESLVLHEGLADYFNFARTGNACLGESICPDTSFGNRICFVPKKCLRTGENTLKLTQSDLPKEPHQRSQFISGMLWDLNIKDGLPLDEVTHLVLKSIDLLVSDSGYQHFVIGLMMADFALYKGVHCPVILNRALDRGLTVALTGVTCEIVANSKSTNADKLSSQEGFDKTVSASTPVASKSRQKASCGMIAGSAGDGQNFGLLLILGLPLVVGVWRKIQRK